MDEPLDALARLHNEVDLEAVRLASGLVDRLQCVLDHNNCHNSRQHNNVQQTTPDKNCCITVATLPFMPIELLLLFVDCCC